MDLKLLQFWVEAGKGHVTHVSARWWVTLTKQCASLLGPISHPLALIFCLDL